MITPEIKQKLSKVYALVNRGSTEGEKAAAQKALEKMLEKYQLEGIDLEELARNRYHFTYTTNMEIKLMEAILNVLIEDNNWGKDASYGRNRLNVSLTYLDYVTVSAAYGYFRKHMKAEWNKVCAKQIKRCRTAKTRNAKRAELQAEFLIRYKYHSGLYRPGEIKCKEVDPETLSAAEIKRRLAMAGIEGGQYTTQVTNGLLLEN